MNAPSKLATTWFGEKETALATAIGALSVPLGVIFGLGMGPIFVNIGLCPQGDKDIFATCVASNS